MISKKINIAKSKSSSSNNLNDEEQKIIDFSRDLTPKDFYRIVIDMLMMKNYKMVEFLICNGVTLYKEKTLFLSFLDDEKLYEKYIDFLAFIKFDKNRTKSVFPKLNAMYHLNISNITLYEVIDNIIKSKLIDALKYKLLEDIVVNEKIIPEKNYQNILSLLYKAYITDKNPNYIILCMIGGKKLSSFFDELVNTFSAGTILRLSLLSDENNYLREKVLKKIFLTDVEIDLFIRMKNFSEKEILDFNSLENGFS